MTATILPQLPTPTASTDNALAVSLLAEQARDYATAAKAENTRRSYASAWADFSTFCRTQDVPALPASPETVGLYLTHLAQRAVVGTVRQRRAAIASRHREYGFPSPCDHEGVKAILRGIVRAKGSAQHKKDALTLDVLKRVLRSIEGYDLCALRDRAVLLLGFAGAFRRSEIAALNVEDLSFDKRGLTVTVRRSKTDQEGQGQEIAIPYVNVEALCAVRAVQHWLDAARITEGALFVSFDLQRRSTGRRMDGDAIADLVKRVTRKAGFAGDFSAHSLRAGFCTSAAEAGVAMENIARTTRHKSMTVLAGYIRRADAFNGAALSAIVSRP